MDGMGLSKPWWSGRLAPADGSEVDVAGESACGSKEVRTPPFPFPPPGESRGGRVPPTLRHVARQQKALAGPVRAAPPAREISKRSAEIPLARSPSACPRNVGIIV